MVITLPNGSSVGEYLLCSHHVRIETCELGVMMADRQHRYRTFLLRLWQERNGGKWVWRTSLEDPHSYLRKGFPDLAQLFAFIKQQTEEGSDSETDIC